MKGKLKTSQVREDVYKEMSLFKAREWGEQAREEKRTKIRYFRRKEKGRKT